MFSRVVLKYLENVFYTHVLISFMVVNAYELIYSHAHNLQFQCGIDWARGATNVQYAHCYTA